MFICCRHTFFYQLFIHFRFIDVICVRIDWVPPLIALVNLAARNICAEWMSDRRSVVWWSLSSMSISFMSGGRRRRQSIDYCNFLTVYLGNGTLAEKAMVADVAVVVSRSVTWMDGWPPVCPSGGCVCVCVVHDDRCRLLRLLRISNRLTAKL